MFINVLVEYFCQDYFVYVICVMYKCLVIQYIEELMLGLILVDFYDLVVQLVVLIDGVIVNVYIISNCNVVQVVK